MQKREGCCSLDGLLGCDDVNSIWRGQGMAHLPYVRKPVKVHTGATRFRGYAPFSLHPIGELSVPAMCILFFDKHCPTSYRNQSGNLSHPSIQSGEVNKSRSSHTAAENSCMQFGQRY